MVEGGLDGVGEREDMVVVVSLIFGGSRGWGRLYSRG